MIFGRIVCWWRGRHKWSKPYLTGHAIRGGTENEYAKDCRRCGLVAPVKRRKAKVPT